MRVKRLNHTLTCFLRAHYLFLRTRQACAVGHSLKTCTEALYRVFHCKQSTAYVCCLLRYRISIAVSTLDCFKVLTARLSWCNNTENFSLNVSITWRLQQTYSGRQRGAPEQAFIVYWSALSLREALMGAWGSLIKLTLRVTHRAEAAASQHRDATMNTFSSFFFILPGCPVSHKKSRGCKWVMSAYNAQLLHPPLSLSLLLHHFSVPKVPLPIGISQNPKLCLGPRVSQDSKHI